MTGASSVGGAAGAGGFAYQSRAAAWFAVRVLAEQGAPPKWELPPTTTLEAVFCETSQPVDDILVETSAGGFLLVQAKHGLKLEKRIDSELAKAVRQFVQQTLRPVPPPTYIQSDGRERPLDRTRDRLLLITENEGSASIREHLRDVLNQLRALPPSQTLNKAARTQAEQEAPDVVYQHVITAWKAEQSRIPSEEEIRSVLVHVWVDTIDADKGGRDEDDARTLLRRGVLQSAPDDNSAWKALTDTCLDYCIEHRGTDRLGFQKVLLDIPVTLQGVRSYQDDIQSLREHTQTNLDFLAETAALPIPGEKPVPLARRCVGEALQALEQGLSFVIIGEPGVGKSGILYEAARATKTQGRDVVVLSASRLGAIGGLVQPGTSSGIALKHDLLDILRNWPGRDAGVVLIDALDTVRGELGIETLIKQIRLLLTKPSRWHVLATVREFDLRVNSTLRRLFQGTPITSDQTLHQHGFEMTRHLFVPPWSDEELQELESLAPVLAPILADATAELRELLRIPFNLRLISELLEDGISAAELTPLRTQAELLDRYWQERIIRTDDQGTAREVFLHAACKTMVQERTLNVQQQEVFAHIQGGIDISASLNDLQRHHVLSAPKGKAPVFATSQISFTHLILFDYATYRLLLGDSVVELIEHLAQDRAFGVMIRPSLIFYFHTLWDADTPDGEHATYWNAIMQFEQASKLAPLEKTLWVATAIDRIKTFAEIAYLVKLLSDQSEPVAVAARAALKHLVSALLTSNMPLAGAGAGPWCSLLAVLGVPQESQAGGLSNQPLLHLHVADGMRLLLAQAIAQPEGLTVQQRLDVGTAARALLSWAWKQEQQPWQKQFIRIALQGVCRSFASDPSASAALLRQCLAPSHLEMHGYHELPILAGEVTRLVTEDAALVDEIYRTTFSFTELSEEAVPVGDSQLFPFSSSKKQDYQDAIFKLTNAFPTVLRKAPNTATLLLSVLLSGEEEQGSDLEGLLDAPNADPAQEIVDSEFQQEQGPPNSEKTSEG